MSEINRIGIIGLGWLGESLADFLLENNFSIWGTVRSLEKAERIQKKGIDVSLWESIAPISKEVQVELAKLDLLILNLPPNACSDISYGACLSSFLQYTQSNTKVIFTSSTSVYPNNLADAKEDYKHKPEEANKVLEAESVLSQQLGLRLCILRLAGLIGEDRHPVFHLAKKTINDAPNKKVNLIHRRDILKILLIVIQEDHFGEIFNVCHPDHPTRKLYYSKMTQEYNLPDIQFIESSDIPTNKIVNCRKLQEVLNFKQFEKL